jgi:hypothetical protein
VFSVYPYVHTIPTSTFRCRFVRLELLSLNSDFALTLLLIVVTRMSTYLSPMYYAVFFRLVINVLSSFAWLLELSRPDFIQTSTSYSLRLIGQIAALTLHNSCVVLASSHPISSQYFHPVSGFQTTGWHPVIRP